MDEINLFRDFVNKHHLLLPLSFVLNFVTLDGSIYRRASTQAEVSMWEMMPRGHGLYSNRPQLNRSHHLSQPHFSIVLAE